MTKVDCNRCENRGQVNGLSQETYCDSCVHFDTWKKDYFAPRPDELDPDEIIFKMHGFVVRRRDVKTNGSGNPGRRNVPGSDLGGLSFQC